MIVLRKTRSLPRLRRRLLAASFALTLAGVASMLPSSAQAGTAYMQYSTSPPNDFAGTAGAACSTASTTYAWPDANGHVLQCVSNVWTLVNPSSVYNASASTTISWAQGTSQYTSASCGSFSFSSMTDGGTYQLTIDGTTSGTCSFSNSDSPTLTFRLPSNHGATTSGKKTIYSFVRNGTDVFVTWVPGY
jgi:hypothetical protein